MNFKSPPLFISNVLLDSSAVNILIADGCFQRITPASFPSCGGVPEGTESRGRGGPISVPPCLCEKTAAEEWNGSQCTVIDGSGKAILPPFYNAHTHAGMSLLRGYADDMALFAWLQNAIWPAEDRMSREDILAGARLAMLEMIKGGTVFFNDMYWHGLDLLPSLEALGMRAALSRLHLESAPGKPIPRSAATLRELDGIASPPTSRLQFICTAHAIYTVCEKSLCALAEEARARGERLQIHASETHKEVEDCIAEHGRTPIAYLDSCGFLGPDTLLIHCVHLSDADIALIAERGCTIVHNPSSNYKLASGVFRWDAVEKAGIRIALGTDSNSSNNALSMFSEMKLAALSAKIQAGDPEAGKAERIWKAATRHGAEAFGLDAGGQRQRHCEARSTDAIQEGAIADAILVDMDHVLLTPCHDLRSNMVYAADTGVVDTVICDGRILMRDRHVPGEDDILAEARHRANAP